ncbi:MAG: hypothetical protein QXI16_07420, partial [Sulfolobaceae archaeon]
MSHSNKKLEYLPVLVPSVNMTVHSSVAFSLVPYLLLNGVNIISNVISKYGTPIARQMLLDSLQVMDKQYPLIKKQENGEVWYYTLWIDDDIIINQE